ncbi:MAG: hypothetical protein AB7O64_12340 [Methylibium sp.]
MDADALPDDRRAQFLRRKLGIQLYFEGATEADIRAACGYGRSHIYRLITERCLAQHPDGNVNGRPGALPRRLHRDRFKVTPFDLGEADRRRLLGLRTRAAMEHNFACSLSTTSLV